MKCHSKMFWKSSFSQLFVGHSNQPPNVLCGFKVRVPEDTSPWKDILQISAQDGDTNSKLVYSIHSSLHPDSTKLFHLDPKSGVLVMTEELDYEKIAVHTLTVMVLKTADLLPQTCLWKKKLRLCFP